MGVVFDLIWSLLLCDTILFVCFFFFLASGWNMNIAFCVAKKCIIIYYNTPGSINLIDSNLPTRKTDIRPIHRPPLTNVLPIPMRMEDNHLPVP